MKAIALLEVQAMVTAIVGLDAMVKAANVRLIHVEKRLGGRLVTVVVEGEVSAVTAALDRSLKIIRAAETPETDPNAIHSAMLFAYKSLAAAVPSIQALDDQAVGKV